jgi:hypothetical protein
MQYPAPVYPYDLPFFTLCFLRFFQLKPLSPVSGFSPAQLPPYPSCEPVIHAINHGPVSCCRLKRLKHVLLSFFSTPST